MIGLAGMFMNGNYIQSYTNSAQVRDEKRRA